MGRCGGGLSLEDCLLPSCAWAHWHCQALTQPVEGPAPGPAPAGLPGPGGGQRQETKAQSLPAQAPTPWPAPGTEGPEPRGSPGAKVAPRLCLRRENPALPPPGLPAMQRGSPIVRRGGRERGEEPAAARLGFEPKALCSQALPVACHHTGGSVTAPVRGHSGRGGAGIEPGQLSGSPWEGAESPSCSQPCSPACPPTRGQSSAAHSGSDKAR